MKAFSEAGSVDNNQKKKICIIVDLYIEERNTIFCFVLPFLLQQTIIIATSTQHNCSCELNVGFFFNTSTCLTSVFSQKSSHHSHLNNSSRATVIFYYNVFLTH